MRKNNGSADTLSTRFVTTVCKEPKGQGRGRQKTEIKTRNTHTAENAGRSREILPLLGEQHDNPPTEPEIM